MEWMEMTIILCVGEPQKCGHVMRIRPTAVATFCESAVLSPINIPPVTVSKPAMHELRTVSDITLL